MCKCKDNGDDCGCSREKPKIKVGDRVRVLRQIHQNHREYYRGDLATVTSVSCNSVRVDGAAVGSYSENFEVVPITDYKVWAETYRRARSEMIRALRRLEDAGFVCVFGNKPQPKYTSSYDASIVKFHKTTQPPAIIEEV